MIQTFKIFYANDNIILGCDDPDSCKCDVSLRYGVDNGLLSTVVDSDKEIQLNVRVKNNGTEPAYGMALNIFSTVPLSNTHPPCTWKDPVSCPSIAVPVITRVRKIQKIYIGVK